MSVRLPQYIAMAPTVVREPFHRDGWVYEEKVDGWRMLAYKDRDRVRLVSRNGVNHTKRFPDLATAIAKLTARTLVLDGEVAIFDQRLRSRFDWLREPDPAAVATPPVYIAFDMMFRDGRDLARLPLSARRIHLEDVIDGADLVLPARRLATNGLDAWAQVVGNGYEGYVAKEEASSYSGGPTRSWLKVKVPGWTDSEDRWKRVRLDTP
jgi:bifunctional non-homologous end joining protein LigD